MSADSQESVSRARLHEQAADNVRADLRDLDAHHSWREVRAAQHLPAEGGHE